ncbi:MAG TPA: glycoside hydrolase family 97 catalytic domain-containing protein [Pyrinomonadaceae bacterium]|nr:glycoside hydrolase family 97 catalytic domain-containing protein [Pyrinomonadaceae bacterium]
MTMNTRRRKKACTRRAFLSVAVAAPALFVGSPRAGAAANGDVKVSSPDGRVRFELVGRGAARLGFRVTLRERPVIETSPLGIVIDGVDLSEGAEVVRVETYRVREKYPWRGVHSEAIDHCHGARVFLAHAATKTAYTVEARAYNDGVAFRHVVPGEGKQRVPDEATAFKVPAGSVVWFHDFEGHYEGVHARRGVAEVKAGEWAAPPLTVKLPGGAGYASITEAALVNYAGMGLRADGARGFEAVLGHALPISYPFKLRYGDEEGKRLSQPAAIAGTIKTPWRVVMAGADLNALVNSDIVHNVSPPPDKTLFPRGPNTEWVRPGRAVWKYLDGGENNLETAKEFSRLAGQLGFEHNVVEGFWRNWSEAEMRELVEYSKRQGVGVWFWKHSRDLRTPEKRREFFGLCQRVGVVGTKIDFLDHEAKEVIDHYQALLRGAAEHKLMVNFHGANKPAGEARTWPNELTREGVRGLEYRRAETRATHNTTLPFTRLLAGHADYTPVIFGERRRETSWAHQIATAAVFTSPVLIYGAHPKTMLEHPAVEMLKSIPAAWDETRVLAPSEIGEVALFARRRAATWFLVVLNGAAARTLRVPLSFLGGGKHQALLVRDNMDEAAAVEIENTTAVKNDALTIELRAGGGFIARFQR